MADPIRLSIVIVNWNVCELLRGCLQSVREHVHLDRAASEVIVVDNDSADGSVAMVHDKFPEVRLIESGDNLGFAAGCNLGFKHASGDFIWLLNPDTVVHAGVVESMLEEMDRDSGLGILGARLVNEDGSFQRASGGAFPSLRNVAWNYLFLNRLLPRAWAPAPLFMEDDPEGLIDVDWVSGAAMLLRRAALGDRIFDEAFFMFGEDMDVCARIRNAGWKVRYTGRATVTHFHGRSFEKQGSVEVLATAHKGPRRFFARRRGRGAVFTYDLLLLTGYLVRWPLYRLLSVLRPAKGYGAMAGFSRRYVKIMLGVMRSGS